MPEPINISASRGAAILGLSKWSTPVEAWLKIMEAREPGFCEKHNYEKPERIDSAQFRWGHAFESAIIELAEGKHGCEIKNREMLYEIKNYITCHIDGCYYWENTLHEGKTTSIFYFKDHFGEPGTDQVPIEYWIQCQHQMICTGAERVILSVLVFPRRVEEWEEIGWDVEKSKLQKFGEAIRYKLKCPDKNWKEPEYDGQTQQYVYADCIEWARTLDQMGYFYQYEITANQEAQNLMIKHYTDFWNNHVLTGTPPEEKNYDDIRRLHREPTGTIVATEEIERLTSEMKNIKAEISGTGPLSRRAEQIRVELLKYMSQEAKIEDDDSTDKWILRDRTGKKIATYGKNKNGVLYFR